MNRGEANECTFQKEFHPEEVLQELPDYPGLEDGRLKTALPKSNAGLRKLTGSDVLLPIVATLGGCLPLFLGLQEYPQLGDTGFLGYLEQVLRAMHRKLDGPPLDISELERRFVEEVMKPKPLDAIKTLHTYEVMESLMKYLRHETRKKRPKRADAMSTFQADRAFREIWCCLFTSYFSSVPPECCLKCGVGEWGWLAKHFPQLELPATFQSPFYHIKKKETPTECYTRGCSERVLHVMALVEPAPVLVYRCNQTKMKASAVDTTNERSTTAAKSDDSVSKARLKRAEDDDDDQAAAAQNDGLGDDSARTKRSEEDEEEVEATTPLPAVLPPGSKQMRDEDWVPCNEWLVLYGAYCLFAVVLRENGRRIAYVRSMTGNQWFVYKNGSREQVDSSTVFGCKENAELILYQCDGHPIFKEYLEKFYSNTPDDGDDDDEEEEEEEAYIPTGNNMKKKSTSQSTRQSPRGKGKGKGKSGEESAAIEEDSS